MPISLFPLAAGLGAIFALGAANFVANHLAPRHPRFVYVLFVVLLAGIAAPMLALRTLTQASIIAPGAGPGAS